MHYVTQYFGTDWAAMVATLFMLRALGSGHRTGFVYGAVSNVFWIAFSVLAGSVGSVIANVLFLAFNIRGYLTWKPKDEGGAPTGEAPTKG